MNNSFDAMVAGHICLDITPVFAGAEPRAVDELFAPGGLVNLDGAAFSPGGPVSNTGLALHLFGMKICISAGVGADAFGSILLGLFKQYGLGETIRPAAGAATSFTIVLAPPGIDRIFLHCTGCNDTFSVANIDRDALAASRLFHIGYPPLMRRLYEDEGRELERILRIAKESGLTTSLDMSLPDPLSEAGRAPWPSILRRVLPLVDIFLPSLDELWFMLERENYLAHKSAAGNDLESPAVDLQRRLAAASLALGCGVCAIKSGRRGIYLRSAGADRMKTFGPRAAASSDWAGRELWAPSYAVDRIVSATGSGDSSIAAFIAAFLRGLLPERALQLACAAGRFNLGAIDSLSGLPDWATLEQFVEAGPGINDPELPGKEFEKNLEAGIFIGCFDGI